jgi:3-hydroxyethyl bacteriochlorophyllide a dehydrogenase
MTKSRAIVFTSPYQVELQELEIPKPDHGEVLVKTLYTGVSTGTETRVLSGNQTGGDFPLIPGYENIGRIVESGESSSLNPGDIVFHTGSSFTGRFTKCWGAHLEYALVKETEVYSVPEGLDPEDGVYAKVGAIALHGVKRAEISEQDTVVIVGLGLIGHLAAQCAKAYHARVIGVDTNPERLKLAAAAGIEYVVDASREDVKLKVDEYADKNVSVAIDVTGIADTIKNTAKLVRSMPWSPPYPPSPKLVILGSYTDPIVLDYDPLFMDEVDILFSRDTRSDDIDDMLNLLNEKKVNPRVLTAKCFDVDDAPQAYKKLVEKKLMRVIFKW